MHNNEKARFIRWQGYQIAQFSIVVSMVTLLSVTGLNHMLASAKGTVGRGVAHPLLMALVSYGMSVVFGILILISRLLDFRLTAQRCRETESCVDPTLFGLDADEYGKLSWKLLWCMLLSYFVAVACSVKVVSTLYLPGLMSAVSGVSIIIALAALALLLTGILFPEAIGKIRNRFKSYTKLSQEIWVLIIILSFIAYRIASKYIH